MKYYIKDYIYDSERLLLYPSSLTNDEVMKICSAIQINDNYSQVYKSLVRSQENQVSFSKKTVRSAGIVPTFNCGFRCNYCSQNSVEGRPSEITYKDMIVFIKNIIQKRIITSLVMQEKATLDLYFTGGGEPTYDWNLFKKIVDSAMMLCAENGVKLSLGMTTNGLLNDNQREYIAQHFEKVLVSFDGIPEIQNRNRQTANGSLTSEIVEKTVTYFSESDVKTTIRSTVWHFDFIKLPDMLDYIMERFPKISSWDVNPVTPAGRATNIMIDNKDRFAETNFVEHFIELLAYAKKQGCRFGVTTPLISSEPVSFNCGGISLNTQGLWLFPNGRINTCVDSSEFTTEVGRVENGNICYYENYLDNLIEVGIKKFEKCRECIAFRVCGSGCPIKHMREAANSFGLLDWECGMQIYFWEHILKNLCDGNECFGWYRESVSIPNLECKNIYKITYKK